MSRINLIVGLGNPGQQYAETRHNAGFWFVEQLAKQYDIALSLDKKFHGLVGRGQIAGQDVRLLLPQTYMNKSGDAVAPMVKFYGYQPAQVLIAHDELDLPAAKMRLKTGGGHGGHNGLRDIVPHIGADFHRLRLGIGHPGDKLLVTGFVLGKASKKEQQALQAMLDAALEQVPNLVTGKLNLAQQAINSFQASN